MTDEQAQQLAAVFAAVTQQIGAPGQFTDPGGANLNVPWATGWTWQYVVEVDNKLGELIRRMDALES